MRGASGCRSHQSAVPMASLSAQDPPLRRRSMLTVDPHSLDNAMLSTELLPAFGLELRE